MRGQSLALDDGDLEYVVVGTLCLRGRGVVGYGSGLG